MSGIVGSRLNNRGSGLIGSLGTDGQVFTSAGAGAGAVFEAAAGGGGKILQVQHANIDASTAITAVSFTATGVTDIITPSADTSKILVMMDVCLAQNENSGKSCACATSLYRDINGGGFETVYRPVGSYAVGDEHHHANEEIWVAAPYQIIFVDEPNTTEACTYTLYLYVNTGDNVTAGSYGVDSHVTLMK